MAAGIAGINQKEQKLLQRSDKIINMIVLVFAVAFLFVWEVGAIYEVYIDVLAINNFFVDLWALLAVNLFLKRKVRPLRLLFGAVLSTFLSCLAFAICRNLSIYLLFVNAVLYPAALYVTFRPKSRGSFFTDLCMSYLAFILLGGMMGWLYAGGNGYFSYEAAAIAALCLLTVVVLYSRQWLKNYSKYIQTQIIHQGKRIRVRALSDSGNLLHDPYTGKPVSMVDRAVYEKAYGTPQAIRLIPYESLGCGHGLLEAVTIDELDIMYGSHKIRVEHAVLGLAEQQLFLEKPYKMIVNLQELMIQ